MRTTVAKHLFVLSLMALMVGCRGRSILEQPGANSGDAGVDGAAGDALGTSGDATTDAVNPDGGFPDGGPQKCSTGCVSAPPPVCLDATHSRHFNLPGKCANNECAYTVSDVVCTRGCEAGFCREDACLGVNCDVPPSACLKPGTCTRGQCTYAPGPAAALCDDHDSCTTGDLCDAQGGCKGGALACNAPPVPTCASASTSLVYDPVGVCGSGVCAFVSRTVQCAGGCTNGVCKGDPCEGVTCNQPPGSCYAAAGVCVGGACSYTMLANGSACTDGNECTTADTCQAGLCRGGSPLVCADADACTGDMCDPARGCVHPVRANGFPCDDKNSCTSTDVCRTGACHGETLACDDGNGCTVDTCDIKTGGCQHLPIAEGTACTDQSVCTTNDVCTVGKCVGQAVSCDDKNACTVDACDATAGCRYVPAVDGANCTDQSPCTRNDMCVAGVCKGEGLSCDDANPCTKDMCNPQKQMCDHMPAGQGVSCDDKNACTGGDRCGSTGVCAGAAVSCDDGNPCTAESCDPIKGCGYTRLTNGITCDDQDPCTSVSQCLGGVCLGTAGLSCDDAKQCTVDSCDLVSGLCSHVVATDGSSCGGPAGCKAGQCAGGTCADIMSNACDDMNPCSAEACNADGSCTRTNVADGIVCDDGSACSTGDRCASGLCKGVVNTCDDGNSCTTDVCGADGTCGRTAVATGTGCSSGNACLMGEVCTGSVCGGGQPRSCDDNNSCTADLCDPKLGCVHLAGADGSSCNDGNLCTQGDQCKNGSCGGTPVTCATSNKCLSGSCNPAIGCTFQMAPNGTTCNDGDKCTSNDSCNAGACGGTEMSCDDGNPCTTDSCAPLNGMCVSLPAPAGTACDDKNPCTMNDQCESTSCRGAPVALHSACQTAAVTGCCVNLVCCNQPGCCQ